MRNALQRLFDDLPAWLRNLLVELWPLLVLILAVTIEFAHIASSSWLQLFFYNGDSLTLPVLSQELSQHQPFLWVSSSQLLFFPEGIFYAISSILTTSVRATLVFNSYLNILVLYCLFRWFAAIRAQASRYAQQLFALGCSGLLVFYMLLERHFISVNENSIATLYLFSAYYYGVIVSGAFLLCVLFKSTLTSTSPARVHVANSSVLLLGVAFLVTLLTTFSDPIFVVQFFVPLVLALGIAYVCNTLNLRTVLGMLISTGGGVLIGYLARLPFKAIFGVSLGSHVATQLIPGTLAIFHASISADLHNKSGAFELLLAFCVIAYSLAFAILWLYRRTRAQAWRRKDGWFFFMAVFCVIEPAAVIIFSIAIGSMVTRYLLPLFIFPLFGLLPILYWTPHRIPQRFLALRRIIMALPVTLIIIVALLGVLSIPTARTNLSATAYADPQCLNHALDNKAAYGIGSFWNVRSLDVYGQADEEVLQVSSSLKPFVWETNLGAYKDKRISFIVASRQPGNNVELVTMFDPAIPADPVKKVNCGDLEIYMYAPGTWGYNRINQPISSSYGKLVTLRSEGKILQTY